MINTEKQIRIIFDEIQLIRERDLEKKLSPMELTKIVNGMIDKVNDVEKGAGRCDKHGRIMLHNDKCHDCRNENG